MRSVYLDFVPFKIYETHTSTSHTQLYIWILVTGWRWKFFLQLGLSPPRDAHTQKWWVLRKIARYSHPSGFSHLRIKPTINLLYWTLPRNFAWKSYSGTHISLAVMWCAVVNTHAGWTWQLDAFLNLQYLQHWMCSILPRNAPVSMFYCCVVYSHSFHYVSYS